MTPDDIPNISSQDCKEDTELLLYLTESAKQVVSKYQTSLTKQGISYLSVYIHTLEKHLQDIHNQLLSSSLTHTTFLEHFNEIRSIYTVLGGVTTAPNWQSPSYNHSLVAQAGTETGTIYAAINDYKRDQHQQGRHYEQAFQRAYIDHPFLSPLCAFATSSGMAALTTIIGFLLERIPSTQSILVGASSYFENSIVFKRFFGSRVIQFDEQNIEAFKQLLHHRPGAIFFDSIGNNPTMSRPDTKKLLEIVYREKTYEPFVVIDNTGLSVTFQPFGRDIVRPKNTIIWESLLKYHQFGMDRVTGGILYAPRRFQEGLYASRDHLGTNIPEASVACLPEPNRKLLEHRLTRHARNTVYLTAILRQSLNHTQVIVPQESFCGSLMTFEFPKTKRRVSFYQQIVKRAIVEAKKRHIHLNAGTSFGLPVTRLYVPASRPGQGTPFLRVAVGTEPMNVIQEIAEILASVLE